MNVRCIAVLIGAALVAGTFFARGAEDETFAEIQGKISSFKLDNGLCVILFPRGYAPVVSCVTYVKVGSADEVTGITGVAHQLEHLAFKGTALVGTKDYAAEQKVLAELDVLYAKIQEFQSNLPAAAQGGFLSFLAKLSSGGPEAAPEKIAKTLAAMADAWGKQGLLHFPEGSPWLAELTENVQHWAAKIQDAEAFVNQNQYAGIIDRAGGSGLNAFTSNDRTVYFVSLPSTQLELWAALESDRFMNLTPRQLEKEKQVVLEERRMRTDMSPFGKLYESFVSTAFVAHPYAHAVIGHRADILNYSREKVSEFYHSKYSTHNTVLCLVGGFDPAKAKEIVTNYFSKLPATPAPPEPHTQEPPQEGERRVDVEYAAQSLLLLGWHVPERNHPDTPALTVLSEVASTGRTSRFYGKLIKTRLALSASAWLGPGERFPRLFCIDATPSEGTSLEQMEQALLEQVEGLKRDAPSAEELQRVVTSWRANLMRELKSNQRMAVGLADHEALDGDWHKLFTEIEAVAKVTPEQVVSVARRYLTKNNRTVARLVPTDAETPTILGVPAEPPKPETKKEEK